MRFQTINGVFQQPLAALCAARFGLQFRNDGQGAAAGSVLTVTGGSAPGQFGWLSWTGSSSVPTLVSSLQPGGNSETYVNPSNSADHTISVGDWVQGNTGGFQQLESAGGAPRQRIPKPPDK